MQREHRVWATKNFGLYRPAYQPLLGAVEEIGELAHAHLKNEQDIRTSEDHMADAKDAVADTIIYLVDYCNLRGWDLELILSSTWEEVKKRDWTKNKEDGLR